jgi:hypothetical protein
LPYSFHDAVKSSQFNVAVYVAVFMGFIALGGQAIGNDHTSLALTFFLFGGIAAAHGAFQERRSTRLQKEARAGLGRVLEQLADCEMAAYQGSNVHEYDELLRRLEGLDKEVERISSDCLNNLSFASRYRAVNVLDVHLDEATKGHFISRAQGNFWSVYQKIKAQRSVLVDILKEL